MNRTRKSLLLSSTVAGALFLSATAHAALITVNYTADLVPNDPAIPNVGSGSISGSLGTFDVNAVGDMFELPTDGSLFVSISGFNAGFPNGGLPFVGAFGNGMRPPTVEFLSIGATPNDFSIRFIDNNGGLFTSFPNPCALSGISGNCTIILFDDSNTGQDLALASFAQGQSDNALGPLIFNYELVDAPAEVPLPAALPLMAAGLGGLTFFTRNRKAKKTPRHRSNA